MELAVELLAKMLERQKIEISFPDLHLSAQALLESASYQALCRIQAILKDDALSDPECLQKIEAIVRVLEDSGGTAETGTTLDDFPRFFWTFPWFFDYNTFD